MCRGALHPRGGTDEAPGFRPTAGPKAEPRGGDPSPKTEPWGGPSPPGVTGAGRGAALPGGLRPGEGRARSAGPPLPRATLFLFLGGSHPRVPPTGGDARGEGGGRQLSPLPYPASPPRSAAGAPPGSPGEGRGRGQGPGGGTAVPASPFRGLCGAVTWAGCGI